MRMFTIVILALFASLCAAEDVEVVLEELPASVQRAAQQFNDDLIQARQEYLEAIEEARDKALRDLERSERAVARAGVDQMLMYRQLRTNIEEHVATDLLGNFVDGEEGTTEQTAVAAISGTWNATHASWRGTVVLNSDGSFVLTKSDGYVENGDWTISEEGVLALDYDRWAPEHSTWNGESFEGVVNLTRAED